MSDHIEYSAKDGVGRIVLARPEKLNAVTKEMARELRRICLDIDADDKVRVATITGAGDRAFSAGSDLNGLADLSDLWAFRNRVEYAAAVRDMRKPVIAGLKGWVLGGGLEMALAADIRVAGRSAKFGGPEVTRGWVGGGGATQMLPRLVGYGQAARMLLVGDPVDAENAFRIGLVEELVEDSEVEKRIGALAAAMAALSPVAVQSTKAAIRAALSTPLEAGIRYENEIHVICMADKDRMEGIKAFQEKRQGRF